MRNQLFHLPNSDGSFSTCDLKKICMAEDHSTACRTKCHQEHQQIAVKGHGGKRYVLVDDHGAHVIVEDDLTPAEFDGLAHIKEVATDGECGDCDFEVWTEREWAREMARMKRENVQLAKEGKPLLAHVDRNKKPTVATLA